MLSRLTLRNATRSLACKQITSASLRPLSTSRRSLNKDSKLEGLANTFSENDNDKGGLTKGNKTTTDNEPPTNTGSHVDTATTSKDNKRDTTQDVGHKDGSGRS